MSLLLLLSVVVVVVVVVVVIVMICEFRQGLGPKRRESSHGDRVQYVIMY